METVYTVVLVRLRMAMVSLFTLLICLGKTEDGNVWFIYTVKLFWWSLGWEWLVYLNCCSGRTKDGNGLHHCHFKIEDEHCLKKISCFNVTS